MLFWTFGAFKGSYFRNSNKLCLTQHMYVYSAVLHRLFQNWSNLCTIYAYAYSLKSWQCIARNFDCKISHKQHFVSIKRRKITLCLEKCDVGLRLEGSLGRWYRKFEGRRISVEEGDLFNPIRAFGAQSAHLCRSSYLGHKLWDQVWVIRTQDGTDRASSPKRQLRTLSTYQCIQFRRFFIKG